MLTSLEFWGCLIFGPAVYWSTPKGARAWVLFFLSVVALIPVMGPLMVVYIVLGVLVARLPVRQSRVLALVYIATGAFVMLLLRPASMHVLGLVPVGARLLGFRICHLLVELWRGNVTIESPQQLLAWLLFFPLARYGPIERFDHFYKFAEERFDPGQLRDGWARIFVGIVKKAVVVGMLLEPALRQRDLASHLDTMGAADAWVYVSLFFLHGYVNLSAYSDTALGAGRLFGFRIVENYNFPIFATSLPDFWKRWNISVMRFCQAYVYLPVMGATRSPYAATFGVFFVMGLWHQVGVNWVLWGLYHATGMSMYGAWKRWQRRHKRKPPKHVAWTVASWSLTMGFVLMASALTSTARLDPRAGAQLLGRMWGIL